MAKLAGIFRQFWAHDLNNITVNTSASFKEWIYKANDYRIDYQITPISFTITAFDRNNFLRSISQDCNSFICSSLESLAKNENQIILPKSVSWLLIKQYYSAYYAAHNILRFIGISINNMDQELIKKIELIADLYSQKNGITIEKGHYRVFYRSNSNEIYFEKINTGSDSGSHIAMWKTLGKELDIIINLLLSQNINHLQPQIIKISDLIYNLRYIGSNNYSWLSRIRNEINYKFSQGTWFPYSLSKTKREQLIGNIDLWKTDPMSIELKNLTGKELLRFSRTCQFLVALASEMSQDMSERCTTGQTFHNRGYIRIQNLIKS